MEVLYLIRPLWGWGFPYISGIHTAYISLDIQTPTEKVFGPLNIPKTPSEEVFGCLGFVSTSIFGT